MKSERTVAGLFRDKTFRNFLSIVIKYKWLYIWAIVTEMALTGVALVFAEAGRRLFDLAPNVPKDALVLILIVIISVTLLRLLFTFWNNWVKSLLNESVVYEMRRNILNHLRPQSVKQIMWCLSIKVKSLNVEHRCSSLRETVIFALIGRNKAFLNPRQMLSDFALFNKLLTSLPNVP
ncbi:hypothetical protein AB6A23_07255 [Paenibacillus tarimensis]